MNRRSALFSTLVVVGLSAVVVGHASAATVPFTETFAQNSANWFDTAGINPLGWEPSGGPGDSAFASTSSNFAGRAANAPVTLFRGQEEFNSSGNAFVGNWVTGGVSEFHASVAHETGVPVNFFVRFAGPTNNPGANHVFVIPVPSGVWTDLSVPLPSGPLIFEGPLTYPQVFGNIGHVQIGVSTPQSLAGVDTNFAFRVDNVGIVPEPASLTLLVLGAVVVLRQRKIRGVCQP